MDVNVYVLFYHFFLLVIDLKGLSLKKLEWMWLYYLQICFKGQNIEHYTSLK